MTYVLNMYDYFYNLITKLIRQRDHFLAGCKRISLPRNTVSVVSVNYNVRINDIFFQIIKTISAYGLSR